MKAINIRNHFVNKCDWVDREDTVDRIIVGDPDKIISSAVVTWISSFDALRHAAEMKVDLLITHEPTFWDHYDYRDEPEAMPQTGTTRRKKDFIENAGFTILRIHDSWDRFPDIGITSAWAKFLGLQGPPIATCGRNAQHRYDIAPVTLENLAHDIAAKTSTIGQSCVQVVGDGGAVVSRVGVGAGCATNIDSFAEMGCDVSIVVDDGTCYWQDIQRAADENKCVIRVNHGTSEEPGMATLAQYMRDTFPDITTTHLPHGSCFKCVQAE